jgi:hypothetical protein
METEGSTPSWQKSAVEDYREPVESSPHLHTLDASFSSPNLTLSSRNNFSMTEMSLMKFYMETLC